MSFEISLRKDDQIVTATDPDYERSTARTPRPLPKPKPKSKPKKKIEKPAQGNAWGRKHGKECVKKLKNAWSKYGPYPYGKYETIATKVGLQYEQVYVWFRHERMRRGMSGSGRGKAMQ